MPQITSAAYEYEESRRKFFDPLIRTRIEKSRPDSSTPLTDFENDAVRIRELKAECGEGKLGMLISGVAFGVAETITWVLDSTHQKTPDGFPWGINADTRTIISGAFTVGLLCFSDAVGKYARNS